MKKYSSKQGSQLTKTANGYKFQISKDEWKRIGKKAGWMKSAQGVPVNHGSQETQFSIDQVGDKGQSKKTLGYWMRDPEFAGLVNTARASQMSNPQQFEQAKSKLASYCKMNGVECNSMPELLEILG